MDKKIKGKEILGSLHKVADSAKKAADSAKETIQAANIPKVKIPELKFAKKDKNAAKDATIDEIKETPPQGSLEETKGVPVPSSLKVIYYLMSIDGEISKEEDEQFENIGNALGSNFSEVKEILISSCKEKINNPEEDRKDLIYEGIDSALSEKVPANSIYMPSRLLIWNLITIANSDKTYGDDERKLIQHVVRKLNINMAVFLEMESSYITTMDLDKELTWIKTTDRPYIEIEEHVNEIQKRKDVIFKSIETLIRL